MEVVTEHIAVQKERRVDEDSNIWSLSKGGVALGGGFGLGWLNCATCAQKYESEFLETDVQGTCIEVILRNELAWNPKESRNRRAEKGQGLHLKDKGK